MELGKSAAARIAMLNKLMDAGLLTPEQAKKVLEGSLSFQFGVIAKLTKEYTDPTPVAKDW